MTAFPVLQSDVDVDIQLAGVLFPRRGGHSSLPPISKHLLSEAMGKYAISNMPFICRDRLPKETLLRN